MKFLGIVTLCAGAIVLSACGGSSHADCKDGPTTAAYLKRVGDDMAVAAKAGKIDQSKLLEMQKAFNSVADGVPEGDFGALCTKVDELRKKYGL